jgi:hypothetical protein
LKDLAEGDKKNIKAQENVRWILFEQLLDVAESNI